MRTPNSTGKCHTLWDSTVTAVCGLANAIRCEKKVRHVFFCMILAAVIAVAAKTRTLEVCLIVFAWAVALICELFNTALEKAMDYAGGKEIHPLIRQAKDYASACTFVSMMFAGCLTLLFVLYPFLAARFQPNS